MEKEFSKQEPVAVVDIGSNSVRLVVYKSLSCDMQPIFNEKSLCGLGKEVAITGKLPKDGVKQAHEALRRFKILCDFMKINKYFLLATAAVRRASNGEEFIAEIENLWGKKITILTGEEEARFVAMGAIAGFNATDGIVGDLGGGSLELVEIKKGRTGAKIKEEEGISLPLGGLVLRDRAEGSIKKADRIVIDALSTVSILKSAKDKNFIAIGGTWRAIAHLFMLQTGYPLHVLHGFTFNAKDIIEFCKKLININQDDIEKMDFIEEIAKERRSLLPYGALVLKEILHKYSFSNFIISTSGVREGVIYSQLSASEIEKDSLIIVARQMNQLYSRDHFHAEELFSWCEDFFGSLKYKIDSRILKASCFLAEIASRTNPDYRAEEAARMVAYSTLPSITHKERVLLSAILFIRHGKKFSDRSAPDFISILSEDEKKEARTIGSIIRLGYDLSAGQSSILQKMQLEVKKNKLRLSITDDLKNLAGEKVEGRIKQLSKSLEDYITEH